MRRDYKFLKCPDCGKRGVHLTMRPNAEDNQACRYCDWFMYTCSNSPIDAKELVRLKAANRDRESEL